MPKPKRSNLAPKKGTSAKKKVSPLLPQAMENETLQEEASGPANTSNAQPVKQAETITRRTTRTTGAAAAAANPKPQALKAPRQAPADNPQGSAQTLLRGNVGVPGLLPPSPPLPPERHVAFAEDVGIVDGSVVRWGENEWLEDPTGNTSFHPAAASTPARHPRSINLGYEELENDPSFNFESLQADSASSDSEESGSGDSSSSGEFLLQAASPLPRRKQPNGRRKVAKGHTVAVLPAVPRPVPAQIELETVTFDYKVFTERGKPSGHAEEQASKTDIDTSDKFFAVCRRLLRIQGDTELVDLQCKLAKSQPWRAVLTAANVTTLLAEIKIREIKTKQQKPTTIFIVSKAAEADVKAAAAHVPSAAATKNIPAELLSGSEVEKVWITKLWGRWAGSCSSCGPERFCVLGSAAGHTGMAFLQIGGWAKALDAKVPGTTLDHPPKTRLFASYWGSKVPLTDGNHPEPAHVDGGKKKQTADPMSVLATALLEVTRQGPAARTEPIDEDRTLQNFVLDHEDLFPEVIEFLQSLTTLELGRGNGRDWIVYSDKLTEMGFLHIGHILPWKNEVQMSTLTGMPIAQVMYFLSKVRARCAQIMAANKANPV